jgi:hypothetical protein
MMNLRTAAVSVLVVAGSGCNVLSGLLPEVEGSLPPLQTIFIPTPSQVAAATLAAASAEEQAVCADGNDVATALEARIEALNASIEGERALLEALYDAQPTGAGNIVTYTAEAGGRSLNVQLVIDDEDVVITATIDTETPLLAGTYKTDGSEGALTITPEAGEPIVSAWTTDDDALSIARTEGEGAIAAAFNDGPERDTLAVSGTGEGVVTLVAVWNDDGSGAAIEGTEAAGCWGAGADVADLCTVTCDQEILEALPEQP